MRSIGSALLATALFASSAFAATDVSTKAPLAPGKPAGVKQAQLAGSGLLFVVGIGIVAGGIALVASGAGNGHNITNTTNNTNP